MPFEESKCNRSAKTVSTEVSSSAHTLLKVKWSPRSPTPVLLKVWYAYQLRYAYHRLPVRGFFPEKRETIVRDRLASLAGPWHMEKQNCRSETSDSLRSTDLRHSKCSQGVTYATESIMFARVTYATRSMVFAGVSYATRSIVLAGVTYVTRSILFAGVSRALTWMASTLNCYSERKKNAFM